MNKAKGCPFCGRAGMAEMIEHSNGTRKWIVHCTGCSARFMKQFNSEQEAVEMWNRRTE